MPTFVERWSESGVTHHCALGIGKQISTLRKIARLFHLEVKVVAE